MFSVALIDNQIAYTEQIKRTYDIGFFRSLACSLFPKTLSYWKMCQKKHIENENWHFSLIFHNIVIHVRNIRDFIIFIKSPTKNLKKKIRRNENHFKRQPNKTDNNFFCLVRGSQFKLTRRKQIWQNKWKRWTIKKTFYLSRTNMRIYSKITLKWKKIPY